MNEEWWRTWRVPLACIRERYREARRASGLAQGAFDAAARKRAEQIAEGPRPEPEDWAQAGEDVCAEARRTR